MVALALLAVFFLMLFLRMVMPEVFRLPLPTDSTLQNPFARMVNALSILAIPFLLSFFPVYAAARGIKVYDEFVEGAKEAFNVILRIIPFLVTMLVAIGMFKGAGGIDLLTKLLSPVFDSAAFSNRSRAAGIDATIEWKRDTGAPDRHCASPGPG